MRAAITATWALLLGFGVLMLGDGLQGTFLAVRASLEHFPIEVTGLIMSVFSVGFLAGSLLAPRIVERVGHIRVFAALASIASAAILVHAVFVNPITWGGLRLISGFCFAGIYVVAESWLNERATNETRGQLLSVYMVITYVGVALGQLMLNLADPLGYGLFILGSVLISMHWYRCCSRPVPRHISESFHRSNSRSCSKSAHSVWWVLFAKAPPPPLCLPWVRYMRR